MEKKFVCQSPKSDSVMLIVKNNKNIFNKNGRRCTDVKTPKVRLGD